MKVRHTVGVLCAAALLVPACANTQRRTVDAAREQFDNGRFEVGKTTKDSVQQQLGSPSEIKKLGKGEESWRYIRNLEVPFYVVTSDVGTMYSAEYTFDAKGVLRDASYVATPMSNPLVR